MSAVDLLSDYEPATEVPTILANCGQQRDVLRPLRVRAVRAASLSRRNIKVGSGLGCVKTQTCCDAVEWCSQGSDAHHLSREVRLSALTDPGAVKHPTLGPQNRFACRWKVSRLLSASTFLRLRFLSSGHFETEASCRTRP